MKRIRYYLEIASQILLLVICAMLLLELSLFTNYRHLQAGFGDYNDYSYDSDSGWGGSDWGDSDWGGSDWDSGSSWDSYDSDWDSDDYHYSRRSREKDLATEFLTIVFVVVFIVIKIITIFDKLGSSGGSSASRNSGGSRTPSSSSVPYLVKKHDAAFDLRIFPNRDRVIEAVIRENDPDFSMQAFIAYAKNVYMEIQDAWSKRNLSPVRHLLGENLYDQTSKQVQRYIDDGIINALKNIAILGAHSSFYRKDAIDEIITVYLFAKMRDYQYQESDKKIVRGNEKTYWQLSYRMRFTRVLGSKSEKGGKIKAYNCPNCAAPLEVGISEKCPHCGTIVSTIKSEWILHDFEAVNNTMTDEGVEN